MNSQSCHKNLHLKFSWFIIPFHALLGTLSYEFPLHHPSPCFCTAWQWIQKRPDSGPIVLLYVLHEFLGIHNISPEGINQAIIICSLKFVMSVYGDARCSGTAQVSTPSISITTVTLGELRFPRGQRRGKAIMQVAMRARELETKPATERQTEHLKDNKWMDRKRLCLFPTLLNIFLFVLYACLAIGIIWLTVRSVRKEHLWVYEAGWLSVTMAMYSISIIIGDWKLPKGRGCLKAVVLKLFYIKDP